MKDLSYQKLPKNLAKITCVCGYDSGPFPRGPFDPAEALVAYSVEHLKCFEGVPTVYYACAQEFHGKLCILGDLVEGLEGYRKCTETAKGLAPKGKEMHVVEIKLVSSWKG